MTDEDIAELFKIHMTTRALPNYTAFARLVLDRAALSPPLPQAESTEPGELIAVSSVTIAGLAMASGCKALKIMAALDQSGEGCATLNQPLTTDQILQAVAAIAPEDAKGTI